MRERGLGCSSMLKSLHNMYKKDIGLIPSTAKKKTPLILNPKQMINPNALFSIQVELLVLLLTLLFSCAFTMIKIVTVITTCCPSS